MDPSVVQQMDLYFFVWVSKPVWTEKSLSLTLQAVCVSNTHIHTSKANLLAYVSGSLNTKHTPVLFFSQCYTRHT